MNIQDTDSYTQHINIIKVKSSSCNMQTSTMGNGNPEGVISGFDLDARYIPSPLVVNRRTFVCVQVTVTRSSTCWFNFVLWKLDWRPINYLFYQYALHIGQENHLLTHDSIHHHFHQCEHHSNSRWPKGQVLPRWQKQSQTQSHSHDQQAQCVHLRCYHHHNIWMLPVQH